jgi:pimeloyl-ACP methyl ester carboxylesterase
MSVCPLSEIARSRRIALPARGGTMAAYDLGPEDRPVDLVFSHANGFNARTYLSILAPIAARRRILAVDMRGHGGSDLPADTTGRRSWDDLKDDLLALLAAADLDDVTLAGHSMGATVSLLAAAEAPGRVRELVLFEPVIMETGAPGEPADSPLVQGARKRRAEFPDREVALEAYTGRGPFKRWSPAMLADYVQDGFRDAPGGVTLSAPPPWEFDNYIHQAHDARAALRNTRCPVRIYKAEAGSTCRLDAAELDELAPGRGSVETVADVSHFLPMERPDLVVAALSHRLG